MYYLLIGLGPNYCKMANIVVPPGDNFYSYFQTTDAKNWCASGLVDCAPGLKYLDTPAQGPGMPSHFLAEIWVNTELKPPCQR